MFFDRYCVGDLSAILVSLIIYFHMTEALLLQRLNLAQLLFDLNEHHSLFLSSLRAVSREQPLDTLIEGARAPRQQLLEWLENLPPSLHLNNDTHEEVAEDTIRSHGALYVAYYTAHILILRALLRPIINNTIKLDHVQPSMGTVLQASRGLMQTLIKFIRGLDATHQSSFWPAYTRHCLSYPGLFCIMLCFQQREPHMSQVDQNLLATWRKTLRTRVQSWPMFRFAIVKVDAMYWKKIR